MIAERNATIKRELLRLRKLVDHSEDPVEARVAWAMEHAIRWATEKTVGWDSPCVDAKETALLIRREFK